MQNEETTKEVVNELQNFRLGVTPLINTFEQLQQQLTSRLNYLIASDFSLLISILYRLDISEKKLRQLLREAKDLTAGDIIAEMIIERQLQKIAARKAFKANLTDVSEDERW